MNKHIQVAFDVDGTLISLKDDTPRYEIIEKFLMFEELGCHMIIWSGGGIDYAEHWAKKLGLKAQIIEKASIIPDIIVDDMDCGAWKGKVIIKV